MRRTALKIGVGIVLLGIIYGVWIEVTHLSIPCFYRKASGLLCPGCGATDMLQGLLHLDFETAFHCNPPLFILSGVWFLIWIFCLVEKPRVFISKRLLTALLSVSLTVMGIFAVIRNIV